MSPARLARLLFALNLGSLSLFVIDCKAQVANVDDTTSTPIEGAGHDYIHSLSETVNPANGSISLRVQIPTPKGRGITIPFGFAYDSNSANHMSPGVYPNLGSIVWASNLDAYAQGGWSTTFPTLRSDGWTQNVATIAGYSDGQPVYNLFPCYYTTHYTFRDLSGGVHSTYLGSLTWNSSNPPPGGCPFSGAGGPAASGGDMQIGGALPTSQGMALSFPVTISDDAGNVYSYSTAGTTTNNGTFFAPTYVEDRNGNRVNFSQNTITDTLGRTLISGTALGAAGTTQTLSIAGGANYGLTWTSAAANYTATSAWAGLSGWPNSPYDTCTAGWHISGNPNPVVSQISLPNGQLFHFYYGTDNPNGFQNPYGLLSEIDYPSGAWVRYTYQLGGTNLNNGTVDGLNELMVSAGLVYHAASECGGTGFSGGCPYPVPDGCIYHYATPVVATRTVGLAGNNNPILTQTFSYWTYWAAPQNGYVGGTSWTQKITQVTTTDNVTGKSQLTTYTYTPVFLPTQPFANTSIASQAPVESTIQYYDWGNTITPLRTVNKTWLDNVHLKSQQTVLDTGASSQITYSYQSDPSGLFLEETEVDEYDFNASSPTRKTLTTYQSFSGTPGILSDKPCKVLTQDGSGNTFAETDYYYDGGGTLCSPISSISATGGPSGFTGRDDSTFGTSSTIPRGNVTKLTRKCLQSCTDSTASYAYDETGQVLSKVDACGNNTCSDMPNPPSHTTTYSYADSYTTLSNGANASYTPSGNTNAYLTKITDPLGHTASFGYDFYSGYLTISKDQNSQITTYLYNDPFNRPTKVSFPDGGLTTAAYNDSPYNPATPSPSVTTSRLMSGSQYVTSLVASDGLGHPTETLRNGYPSPDPDCAVGDRTDTTYDGMGHVHTVSNPYCPGVDTIYTTTYVYDGLGRTTQVTHPDNSTILTSYTGRATQVQDEGNGSGTQHVTRISQTDALGRLASVCEVAAAPFVGSGGASSSSLIGQSGSPATCVDATGKTLDIAASGFVTNYGYDILGNLTGVTQGTMAARAFSYDSLSRLTTATNPESGTINYTYDANSNLSTKVAPAPNQTSTSTVTTTYAYDVLDRLTSKSYSDGTTPTSYYHYDYYQYNPNATNPIGRLVASNVTPPAGVGGCLATDFSYDPMGRISGLYELTPLAGCANGFPFNYQYDLMGNMTYLTLGFFNPISITLNAAARPVTYTTSGSEWPQPNTLLSNVTYNAAGMIKSDTVGTIENETFTYDARLRLQAATSTLISSNTPDYSFNLTFAPNDNVLAANDSVNGNWNYSYDQFNRLACANLATNGTCATPPTGTPTYTYVYDRFGNRWQQNGQYSFIASFTGNGGANNNRMDGYSYDSAGNLLYDGSHHYFYDAENRLIQVDGTAGTCASGSSTGTTACYYYDAEGHRVHRTGIGDDLCNNGANGGVADFVFDKDGNWTTRTNSTGGGCYSEVYIAGRHFATVGGDIKYNHADWLGTTRYTITSDTSSGGMHYTGTCTGLPFGDGLTCSDNWSTLHFTGKERDSESGLDNFGARYDSSSLGRFMSPDPPLMDQHIHDPQSWNLYPYARNNPLSLLDPTGHAVELLGDEEERKKALALLQKSLGNKDAASKLYVNEVKDGDKTRYFVGIKGDVGDFMKMGATSHDLANLVENKNVVEFGLTKNDLRKWGGAVTYEKGEVGNQNVRVLVNPDEVDLANRNLSPNTILGASRWAGQDKDPRWRVNSFTPEVMTWHEFGHGWGQINGRAADRTNPEALEWENRMREQLYGPLGPNNAPRVSH